jgi:amino acid transporter
MVSIYHPSYIQQNWHQSLVMIAIGLLGTFMNTYGAQHLPLIEGIVLVFHIFGFFCIIIPLWVLAPKAPASEVFGGFNDFGGWGSIGAACFVGTVAAAGSFGGSDAAAHLSEETRDASKSVRKSSLLSVLLIPCENVQSYDGPVVEALILPLASSSTSGTSYAHLIAFPGTRIFNPCLSYILAPTSVITEE